MIPPDDSDSPAAQPPGDWAAGDPVLNRLRSAPTPAEPPPSPLIDPDELDELERQHDGPAGRRRGPPTVHQPTPLPRRRAAGAGHVRWSLARRTDCPPPPGPVDNLHTALAVTRAGLARRAAGAYAVRLDAAPLPAPARAHDDSFDLPTLNPRLALALPLTELIRTANAVVAEVVRAPKALARFVGDAPRWLAQQEAALRRVRHVLDAATARAGGVGAIVLESLCLWAGPDGSRPSARLAPDEMIGVAHAPSSSLAPAWHEVAAVLLGQRRASQITPYSFGPWHRCGRLLPEWPTDVVVHSARAVGGPGVLADAVDLAPALAGSAAAGLFRELLLLAAEGLSLRTALVQVPALLEAWKDLRDEPTRRLTQMVGTQRHAIESALATTAPHGPVVFHDGPAEGPAQQARLAFWNEYFSTIRRDCLRIAGTGAARALSPFVPDPAAAPRPPSAGGAWDNLHDLLCSPALCAVYLDVPHLVPTGHKSAWRALTFEALADRACEMLWQAGAARVGGAGGTDAWRLPFLLLCHRAGLATDAAALDDALMWIDACRESVAPGASAAQHVRAALAGLVQAYAVGGEGGGLSQAVAVLGEHATALLRTMRAGLVRPKGSDGLLSRERLGGLVEAIRCLCVARRAGVPPRQLKLIARHELPAAAAAVAKRPERLGPFLAFVEARLTEGGRTASGESALVILGEWGLRGWAGHYRWAGYARWEPALVARLFELASRLPDDSPKPASLNHWLLNFDDPDDRYGCRDDPKGDAEGARRRAFAARHLGMLVGTAGGIRRSDDAAQFDARWQHWIKCADLAFYWGDAGGDAVRAFRRCFGEGLRRGRGQFFDYHYGDALRILSALAAGQLDRLLELGSLKLDGDDLQISQIADAWACVAGVEGLSEWVSRLACSARTGQAAVRWLSRLGFCLRLVSAKALQEKLATIVTRGAHAPPPAETDTDVPAECAADLARLEGLLLSLGRAYPPPGVGAILRCRRRFEAELASLEKTLAALDGRDGPVRKLAIRADNLRANLTGPGRVAAWVGRQLPGALINALDDARFACLARLIDDLTGEHLRKVVGIDPLEPAVAPSGEAPAILSPRDPRDWDNASRLYFSIDANRKSLRRLMQHEARGDRSWPRSHPANVRFLSRAAAAGVNVEAWRGEFSRPVTAPRGGETWTLAIENDPLRVLQMGNYFGTCLSEGGVNAFAVVANACEANKRVVYVRDARGAVLGRKLLVLTEGGLLVGFRSYGLGPLDPFIEGPEPWIKVLLDVFCRELADACGASLAPADWTADKSAAAAFALFNKWYNDGPEAFDWVWVAHAPVGLREAARAGGPAIHRLACAIRSGVEGEAHAALRAVVWLGEDAAPLARDLFAANATHSWLGERRAAAVRFIARHSQSAAVRQYAGSAVR